MFLPICVIQADTKVQAQTSSLLNHRNSAQLDIIRRVGFEAFVFSAARLLICRVDADGDLEEIGGAIL